MKEIWIIIVLLGIIAWGSIKRTHSYSRGCNIKPPTKTPRPKIYPAPQFRKK